MSFSDYVSELAYEEILKNGGGLRTAEILSSIKDKIPKNYYISNKRLCQFLKANPNIENKMDWKGACWYSR